MTYHTQPGTLPHRVVEWLKQQSRGSEWSTAEICEALGVDQLQGFPFTMTNAVQAGIVRRRFRPENRRLLYWSLGDGKPVDQYGEDATTTSAPPAIPAVEKLKTEQPIAPRPAPKAAAVGIERAPKKAPKQPAATDDFRAGLWTDGTLEIRRGDELLLLTRDEAHQLAQLLAARGHA